MVSGLLMKINSSRFHIRTCVSCMYVVQVEAPTSPYVVFPKFQNGFKDIFRTNPTFTVVSKEMLLVHLDKLARRIDCQVPLYY